MHAGHWVIGNDFVKILLNTVMTIKYSKTGLVNYRASHYSEVPAVFRGFTVLRGTTVTLHTVIWSFTSILLEAWCKGFETCTSHLRYLCSSIHVFLLEFRSHPLGGSTNQSQIQPQQIDLQIELERHSRDVWQHSISDRLLAPKRFYRSL